MYFEGLTPMVERAYGLLLPFGVFQINMETFRGCQIDTYHRAVDSYATMLAVKEAKNQAAEELGDKVGGSIQMQGGGFGFKGAMKGMAQAEAFNAGMGLLGAYVANQNKLSQEEKAELFSKFEKDNFFKEVYSDYISSFFTVVQILSKNGVLEKISVLTGDQFRTMINNLKNPLFPQEQFSATLAKLISTYPFSAACYETAIQKYGETDEIKRMVKYFII